MSYLLALLLLVASSLCRCTEAQWRQCEEGFSFSGTRMARNITHCKRLGTLGAELGMNYYKTSPNSTIDVVFSAQLPSPQGWIAWGVNPGRTPRMVGTRALIAFNGPSGAPVVDTYNITAYTRLGCILEPSSIEVEVVSKEVNYSGETDRRRLTISARLRLPSEYNASRLNHVWQVGPHVVGMVPLKHEQALQNFDSAETMDVNDGIGHNLGYHKKGLRETHGILSVIGWGFLLPTGVIVSRYFRGSPINMKYKWKYIHVGIQILAFSIGVVGWGIGLSLAEPSMHHKAFIAHRIIGIWIFSLATLQMMALCLRPQKADKYKKYWSIYHYFIGYSLITLTILNIFKGFAILKPSLRWKWAYNGILIILSCIALGLEIIVWVKFFLEGKDWYLSYQQGNKQRKRPMLAK